MTLQNKTKEELVLLGQSILNCPTLQIIHPIEELKQIVQLTWEHYEYSTKFPFFDELLYFKTYQSYQDSVDKKYSYEDLMEYKILLNQDNFLCDIMCN